ncbi:MAG: UvrD-helicase domain-containing protein, partial [Legionellales bacterium]|nr:UvrD-helicase domain-containing protein [Legionellales bacterium]
MTKPSDYKQREAALNIEKSFLVQAPAGSGKTHLLISRYLKALLTIDSSADEVLAITFTNKAAQEMRERVLSLLKTTANISCSKNLNDQQQLAFAVNKLDKAKSLNLRNNPNNIKIMTIDALCNNIIQTSNITSAGSFNYKVNPKPYEMYEEAVVELLSDYNNKPWSNSIITVLEYLNNNYNRLTELLIELLQTRDIWLPYVLSELQPKNTLLKLEQNLKTRTDEIISYAISTIPEKNINDIETCLNIYLSSLKLETITLNSKSLQQISTWNHLCNLILTKQNKVRKTANKDIGITAPSSAKNADEKQRLQQQKTLMQKLFNELELNEDLISALCMLRNAPPSKYTEEQANILSALLTLLPIAVAYLSITFKNKNSCDFIEVGIKCNNLLGTQEHPSDHGLKTSENLKHILVDEFQDTSLTQLNLLKKLIVCWDDNEHKSLFFVGDPMQSIYKFRQADVAIFTSLINKKLLNIKLNYINLSCNFRSTATVVNWVNNLFSELFNENKLPNCGNVPFNKAVSFNDLKEEKIKLTILDPKDKSKQNKVIIDIVKDLMTVKEQSVAVLTRSRSHLKQLAHELSIHGISVIAEDMEPLHKITEIIDIANLSLALSNPLDKISWLALLSSPWLALSNKTIHTIANYDKTSSIYSIICTQNLKIDNECQLRLNYALPIIINAVKLSGTSCPANHLEKTWLQLGGAKLIKDENISATIDNLFNLLYQDSILPNSWRGWQQLLAANYVKATPSPGQNIHLLTIHKAKGLEFDHVILPSFNEKSSSNKSKLLNWHNSINKELDLVLGPIPKNLEDNSKIHNYLKQLDKIQTKNENLRV